MKVSEMIAHPTSAIRASQLHIWSSFGGSCGNRRNGFTLIEVLVVVSIIAVMASLLLPAIATAQQIANRTACGSQMRQVFLGLIGYLGDNSDLYPAIARTSAHSDSWGAHRGQGRWQHNLEPYIGTFTVFNCPTVRRAHPRFAVTNSTGHPLSWLVRGDAEAGTVCTMAYNTQDWGRRTWGINPGPMNEAAVAARAGIPGNINRVPVFFDGVWQNDGSNQQNNQWGAYWPHRGSSNLAFSDGHVEVKSRSNVIQYASTSVALIVY